MRPLAAEAARLEVGLRPMTRDERRYVLTQDRGARRGALFAGSAMLLGAGFMWREVLPRTPRILDTPVLLWIAMWGLPIAVTAAALLFLTLGTTRAPQLRGRTTWPRVGTHRGVFSYGGKPVKFWVGDVHVHLPPGWLRDLRLGQEVDVELAPSFADVPRRGMAGRAARAVLSAHGGLLSVDAQVRDGTLKVGRFSERALADAPDA